MQDRVRAVNLGSHPKASGGSSNPGTPLPCPRCSTIEHVVPSVKPILPAENRRRFPVSASKYMLDAIFEPDAILYEVACACGLSGKIATRERGATRTWNQAVRRISPPGDGDFSTVKRRRGAYHKPFVD